MRGLLENDLQKLLLLLGWRIKAIFDSTCNVVHKNKF